jgi:hypothetical protein
VPLVRVEHVPPAARQPELYDRPLGLRQGHHVGPLIRREAGAAPEDVEDLRVKVK